MKGRTDPPLHVPDHVPCRPHRQAGSVELPQDQEEEKEPLAPVSVVVEEVRHPVSHGEGREDGEEGKCSFVQMKGSGGEGCTKGGMTCERKCSYSTGEETCQDQMTVREGAGSNFNNNNQKEFVIY